MKAKTAVIYTRVSTDEQDTKRQVAELQEYARYKGLKVLALFDEKISGAIKGADRLQFRRTSEFIQKENVNNILVWELSRIGRSMRDVINNVEDFTDKGINIYMKKEGMNTLDDSGKKIQWSASS